MRKLAFQQIASKWLKTKIMLQDRRLAPFLPETVPWRTNRLFDMLKEYTVVFLKPDKGGGGIGIIRIEQVAADVYEVRYLTKRVQVTGKHALITLLKRRMQPRKRYLIQQGIRLKQIGGRPFDIRVIVQKPGSEWQAMGMAAKVAAKEKIVTNRSTGGLALTVSRALKSGFGWSDHYIRSVERWLSHIALQTAYTLSARFPNLRVLGLDIGIDVQGNVWIFEVNTRPQFHLFQKTDPAKYRKIVTNQRRIIAEGRMRQRAKSRLR